MPIRMLATFAEEIFSKLGTSLVMLVISSAASFILGRWWGRYRARKQWAAKEFLGRIIVSLNSLDDGTLKIRTIFERSVEEVFLNPHAIDQVLHAAQDTTPEEPLLPIARDERWFLLNFVLNAVAERFTLGAVRQDAGLPVTRVRYALCLTSEAGDELRIRKVRAMLIQHKHLLEFPFMETMPKLENPWHERRVRTLRKLAQAYQTDPDQFLLLELCV